MKFLQEEALGIECVSELCEIMTVDIIARVARQLALVEELRVGRT